MWVSVLIKDRVYDLAKRHDAIVDVCVGPQAWVEVPWRYIERWRARESYHAFGTAPWQDGPSAHLNPLRADARQPKDAAPEERIQ